MNSIPSPDVRGNGTEAGSTDWATKNPDVSEIKARLTDAAAVVRALGLDLGAKQQPNGMTIRCPWHEDTNPSCSVLSYADGIGVKCFACGHTGSIFDLIAVVHGLEVRADFRKVLAIAEGLANDAQMGGINISQASAEKEPAVPDELFDVYARRLFEMCSLESSASVSAYMKSRGLYGRAVADRWGALPDTPADIQEVTRELGEERARAIGLATVDGLRFPGHKLIVPWRSDQGAIATLQRRGIDATTKEPKYIFPAQRAAKQPYGVERLRDGKPVAIVEGALDVLAMRELCEREQLDRDVLGLPGVQNWNAAWNKYVRGRVVLIAVDNDAAGDAACPKLAEWLRAAGALDVVRRIPRGGKDWASMLETDVAS